MARRLPLWRTESLAAEERRAAQKPPVRATLGHILALEDNIASLSAGVYEDINALGASIYEAVGQQAEALARLPGIITEEIDVRVEDERSRADVRFTAVEERVTYVEADIRTVNDRIRALERDTLAGFRSVLQGMYGLGIVTNSVSMLDALTANVGVIIGNLESRTTPA